MGRYDGGSFDDESPKNKSIPNIRKSCWEI